ncbi:hypothetical protein HN51_010053 [Arachis hypogaea]|uniref:Uncharacterized protein n=1 Tax=Arachis hypogaea TaxID=3818 RepID=A0A445E494_ARAHY|nr:UPF0481 protein At3g47200 [Arachis hypogaea]QHO55054.1 UPF0481 protein [Arachis hypogaea]RYR70268.1 hypothetical protein Ahy_A03g016769 [Arachis hypogaea]
MGESLNRRIAHLLGRACARDNEVPRSMIQRIPVLLRQDPNFVKYCTPKMISFGPIHHGEENLKLGEEFKHLWASLYIETFSKQVRVSTEQGAKLKHNIIVAEIKQLRNMFSKDVIGSYNDDELSWLLLVDGCALLYFLDNVDDQHPEALNLKLDQLMYTWRDILLLENQLPLTLLMLLSDEKTVYHLENILYNFVFMGLFKGIEGSVINRNGAKPVHLLDYVRTFYTFRDEYIISMDPPLQEEGRWHRYKNIRDLRNAGIHVKLNKREEWKWNSVSFTSNLFSGELKLPMMIVNDVTPYFYHNLIAFEMCPDFRNNFEFCSYFFLMDSLIDEAEDVKELRLAGVLQNLLGSDKEVAKLFNELGHELPAKMCNYMIRTNVVAYSKGYIQVKHQINEHYQKKWKTWLAEGRSTYFSTPWSFIAFLAAVAALLLTSIQAWYAVHPKISN